VAAGRGNGIFAGCCGAAIPPPRICRSRAKSSIFTFPARMSRASCRGSRGMSAMIASTKMLSFYAHPPIYKTVSSPFDKRRQGITCVGRCSSTSLLRLLCINFFNFNINNFNFCLDYHFIMLILMFMKSHPSISCPVCRGPMIPTELHCPACEITVSGQFAANEFATLAEDELHFLRIFVLTEGRIRDMESALGVSYPTIKARMAQLKASLTAACKAAGEIPAEPRELSVAAILKDLETGHISYEQAMASIRRLQTPAEEPS
jgi:hypothetical protein